MKRLLIRGASQNNLKNIDLEIEEGTICAVCGPSGSGKSSLVFDTIYSESQRRFIETFSPYARQFLERLSGARVKAIKNLPASIGIGRSNPVKNSRSTVATLSEISFSARMLFFRKAVPYCTRCQVPLKASSWQDVYSFLKKGAESGLRRGYICIRSDAGRLFDLQKEGYRRILLNGRVIDLSEDEASSMPEYQDNSGFHIIVERLALHSLSEERIKEAVETAFGLEDTIYVFLEEKGEGQKACEFHMRPVCPRCGTEKSQPSMLLFSFNSPEGACPECSGFGRVMDIDWDLVIPDKSKSLSQGAIRPLENWADEKEFLFSWCKDWGIDVTRPWKELSSQEKDAILFGKDDWYGIKEIFNYLESKRYKAHIRILLSRYRAYNQCPSCKGTRFNQEALSYRLGGLDIGGLYRLSVKRALEWCKGLGEGISLDPASSSLLEDLTRRLLLIKEAGLGYLSLDRQSRTLSGGELSRLCLAKGVSVSLSETLYCLDEPSSGLHPQDVHGVAKILKGLKAAGNTVLMTENDPVMASSADRVIRMGPGSGKDGGRIVGEDLPVEPRLETASEIQKSRQEKEPARPLRFLEIRRASQNNLRSITCRIPIGMLTCVCGVSGSGKSTLVEECLYRGLLRKAGKTAPAPGKFEDISLSGSFDQVVFVDQEPPSRTPRGCPGTYLKILDPIRRLFSRTKEAQALGLGPGFFSLNVDGGRCPHCKGQGHEMLDMQFLPDVMVKCPECGGKRFSKRALEIEFNGKNMSDLLQMTLFEVADFFKGERAVIKGLAPALDLGLGHLLLGQPLNTLSAGDSQRLKIARYLGAPKGRNLFILDEPTRGLYHTEVKGLIRELKRLCQQGNTVIVVEHDLSTILLSDWLIELGPGGGERGGRLIYEGRPGGILEKETPTARALKAIKKGAGLGGGNFFKKEKGAQCPENVIEIRGARHHNLKDLNVTIPRNRFVVVTGVSGSGKSSLAFDLIYKEAQRRYLESLPSYMKQFVRLHERPDVDAIRGLSPSVAIEQRACKGGAMSTVATLSETAHYMRLLYAHCSRPVCPECHGKMVQAVSNEIKRAVSRLLEKTPIYVGAPRIRHRKGWHQQEIERGFVKGADLVLVDERMVERGETVRLSRYKEHSISWLWGPFKEEEGGKDLSLILETALKAGGGTIFCLLPDKGRKWFSTSHFCPRCKISVEEPDPLLFSFHTEVGRCPECLGRGEGEKGAVCTLCKGTRLSKRALYWQIDGFDIASFFGLEIDEAISLIKSWQKKRGVFGKRGGLFKMLTGHVLKRLELMSELGLGYLGLDRSAASLSGGEAQRIALSSQSASNLTGITIVLDEPTIGLHPSDNSRLVAALKDLARKGNSVIVVEHDEETILAGDFVVDLGPGGGRQGGQVVYCGGVKGLLEHTSSRTARGLRNRKITVAKSKRLTPGTRFLRLSGVKRHNLSSVDVRIPIGAVTVVTGVSGSGKTSLEEALYMALTGDTSCVESLEGSEELKGVHRIDHSPIGRTPRSCPATFIGIFSHIRHLFSRTPAARIRGFGPSHFSFNTKEGACTHCGGQGQLRQRLGILPDVYITCPSCQGKRFKSDVLSITWKSRDISQVLDMTVSEALEFFRAFPQIRKGLKVLDDLGLGYLRLGQPSPNLSGGEAQRLKIAKELSRVQNQARLYLLDEPSVGLHMEDVRRLSGCLSRLSDLGNTVLMVEHNQALIAGADWVIDLGPGGGKYGGRVIFQGSVFDFLRSDTPSKTLKWLKPVVDVA